MLFKSRGVLYLSDKIKRLKTHVSLIKHYKNLKLSKKLLVSFVLVSIIPIVLIQFISYGIITFSMEKKINDLTLDKLEMSADKLNTTLMSYSDILYQVYTDDIIAENINLINSSDHKQYALAYNIIHQRIKSLVSAKEGIRSITVVCSNGTEITYDALTASSFDNIWNTYSDIRNLDVYKSALDKNNVAITPTSLMKTDGQKDSFLFHITKKLFDFKDLSKGVIGVAIISINETVLSDACNLPEQQKSRQSLSFIVNRQGKVLSFPAKEFIEADINATSGAEALGFKEKVTLFIHKTGLFNQQKIIVNDFYDNTADWILVNVYDQKVMFQDIYGTQRTTIIIGLIAMIASILIIRYTIKQLVNSVYVIVENMKKAQEGDFSVQIYVEGKDEISDIALRFNKMIFKIKLLVDEVRMATNKQKEAEIRALEAQINPHFLYNTLDSINWMAIEKEEHEISKMLKSLGLILRYSIDKSNQMVTLEKELNWLKQYIGLQQKRFNNSFECITHVEEQLLGIKVYKLLIQPFIENAIIHGFQGVEIGGSIIIDVTLIENKFINIIIEDNGKGMSKELVSRFNNRNNAINNDDNNIGMNNAFARILMYYGDKASWKISSIQQKGTVVDIKLPIIEV